ncbi:Flavorubredoxin [Lachnospiraceae bacterium NK3A20]|nr:Flavorubredoxin [Lachnospiraceae bacterium NK3A20]
MINIQEVAKDTVWIGGSDRRLALFENLFPLPNGVSYNNYVVTDEKIVIFDTSDVSVADQYLENLKAVLAGRTPDYLVVLHMEPDHCSQIENVLRLYPNLTIVTSLQASNMIRQFFPALTDAKFQLVKEGDVLNTGAHTFHFVAAPMVHWPEVLFAFDDCTKALFSADAFGTFGALDDSVFADDYDFEKKYLDEARRYYANIVGKFGMQVTNVLKKAAGLDIRAILPLHGPVWRKDLSFFLDKYEKWASYTPETDDILVVYGSLYGHTASAAEAFAAKLRRETGKGVAVYDASKTDVSYLISEVWRCAKVVIFCPTYNGGIYPRIEGFLNDMAALQVQNRTFALAENGTWGPVTAKLCRAKLETFKNCTVIPEVLTFKSALHESDEEKLDAFVDAVARA